jgi:hypothetical protein
MSESVQALNNNKSLFVSCNPVFVLAPTTMFVQSPPALCRPHSHHYVCTITTCIAFAPSTPPPLMFVQKSPPAFPSSLSPLCLFYHHPHCFCPVHSTATLVCTKITASIMLSTLPLLCLYCSITTRIAFAPSTPPLLMFVQSHHTTIKQCLGRAHLHELLEKWQWAAAAAACARASLGNSCAPQEGSNVRTVKTDGNSQSCFLITEAACVSSCDTAAGSTSLRT